MTKSRGCSDVGTSRESGIHQSWRSQAVQLLATGGAWPCPYLNSGQGYQPAPWSSEMREYTSVALSHQFCGLLGHRSRRGGYGPVHTAPGCHRRRAGGATGSPLNSRWGEKHVMLEVNQYLWVLNFTLCNNS